MSATAEALPGAAAPAASRRFGGLSLLALALCLPSLVPLLSAALALFDPDPETLSHLLQFTLPRVAGNTLWLLLGVGLGTALLGTALAALVALTEFPGRRLFQWALVLPLALPGYVFAVAFIGLFDFSGAFATQLREFGLGVPEIRSRAGVIVVMSLALYPYVYLVASDAFASQGARALEAARALGMSPLRAFFSASLPLARPFIAGGVLLVLMETLADFGTVAAFNYDTFTTAIYQAWFALFSPSTALQIAAVMLVVVALLVGMEAWSRRRQSFARLGAPVQTRLALGRWRWAATGFCALLLGLAFLLPMARLGWLSLSRLNEFNAGYFGLVVNAFSLSAMAAALTIAAALVLAMAAREQPGWPSRLAQRIGTLGYGLPGALLAIGLYVPVTRASGWVLDRLDWDLALQGGLLLLLVAYGVRFTAVAHAPVAGALMRIRDSQLEAARLLGVRGLRRLRQLHWPLLRGGIASAGLLVFVDVMKEMPITLMMRPFGWNTLATRVFELTSEGEWARAALPSLSIVIVGVLPVLLLTRRSAHAA
ncbi:MAG: iron ABC transporter permease [Aquimonas sp.]|nr:iron ABC transporter permease [Aquimonas sp.]